MNLTTINVPPAQLAPELELSGAKADISILDRDQFHGLLCWTEAQLMSNILCISKDREVTAVPQTYFDVILNDETQPAIFKKALQLAKLSRSITSIEARIQVLDEQYRTGNGEIDIALLEMLLVAGEAPLRYQEEVSI